MHRPSFPALIARLVAALDTRPEVQPAPRLAEALQPALIFIGFLLLYLYTSPRGIALEDDGFFVLTAQAWGIAHPPGYPLYTLFAGLFQWLPVGSLAWRIHAFSALCGALTVSVLWLSLRRLLPGSLPALTGAMAFGLSLTFWSQAIVAEVYALNTLLFALALVLLLYAGARGGIGGKTPLRLAALIIGLSLGNHWPQAVLGSPVLLVLLWQLRRAVRADTAVLAACVLMGLTPYLWMLWRSHQPLAFTFAEPFTSLEQFWAYVSRSTYRDVDVSPTAGWLDKLGYLRLVFLRGMAEFAWVGGAAALLGLLRPPAAWAPGLRLGLGASFLASSVLMALLLGFDDQPLNRAVFRVYPLVAWLVAAVWLAAGVAWLRARVPAVGALAAAGCVALPLLLHWPLNDRHAYRWAEDYARAVLADLPPHTTLFLASDLAIGTVAYAHRALGVRPDVQLIDVGGDLVPDPPPIAERPPGMDRESAVIEYIWRDPNPVVFIVRPASAITLRLQRSWLWYRLIRPHEQGLPDYLLPPGQRALLPSLSAERDAADPWTRLIAHGLLSDYAHFISLAAEEPEFRAATPDLDRLLAIAEQDFHGNLARAEVLLRTQTERTNAAAVHLLGEAAQHMDDPIGKRDLSRYYNALAAVVLLGARQEEALDLFERSVTIWPDAGNPAVTSLRNYYRANGAEGLLAALNRRVHASSD
jgi:hypothetical protein